MESRIFVSPNTKLEVQTVGDNSYEFFSLEDAVEVSYYLGMKGFRLKYRKDIQVLYNKHHSLYKESLKNLSYELENIRKFRRDLAKAYKESKEFTSPFNEHVRRHYFFEGREFSFHGVNSDQKNSIVLNPSQVVSVYGSNLYLDIPEHLKALLEVIQEVERYQYQKERDRLRHHL